MVITVQFKGTNPKQISRMVLNLGPELNKRISKGTKEFLDSVKKGAVIMAPKLKRKLSQSMDVRPGRKKGDWIFSVGEGIKHARPVEGGYEPHFVSSSTEAYPGITIAEVYGLPEGIPIWVTGSRRPHFVRDAFQNALARLPQILERKTKLAIKNARR